MGKTLPLLMGWRNVVCNISSHALEFGWVKLPLATGQEKRHLQYLEYCTGVWESKTPSFLMGRTEVVCNISSHVLESGCVRLHPC